MVDAYELPVVLELENELDPEIAVEFVIGAWFANTVAFLSKLVVVLISPLSRTWLRVYAF